MTGTMELPANELLMQAICEKNIKFINYCLASKGVNINKICSNGMTLIGAAAQTGNLAVLKTLLDYQNCCNRKVGNLEDYHNENSIKKPPQYLQLGEMTNKKYKNIGYFVVCRDLGEDSNEFGDGPTPDGMEALEWDMEVNEEGGSFCNESEEDDDAGAIKLYKWYANILTRTSVLLESPDHDIGRLDRHGQSVLHYAVNSGNVDMVDYLLTNFGTELSINQADAGCFSPLHMAAANSDVEMVLCLLKRRADVNSVGGRQRQTASHIAAKTGSVHILRLLIDAGADINILDAEEVSVLNTALRQGNEEAVRLLIRSRARVNHEEPSGVTALRLAIWANNTNIVRLLIEAKARIIHSHYLLHTAISNNNLDMVQMLIEAGAALNIRDDQGHTPLMVACSRKNIPIVKYLLSRGADVNAASLIDGKTALHVCVQDVREKRSIHQLVELLVRYGADLQATSFQGNPLFYSIIVENRSAASALVRSGADVNYRDERSYVDNLSIAKRHGDLELVKLLVFAGFRLKDMILEPKLMRSQPLDPACDFLMHCKTNPLQLKELCRIAIRKQLGPKNILTGIGTLPLPTQIQSYLALDVL